MLKRVATLKIFCIRLILFSVSVNLSKCTSIRRFNVNGILYEDFVPESKYLSFLRTPDKVWKNLSNLVKMSNWMYKSVFCTTGNGTWLLYPEKDFQLGTSLTFQIVVGEECMTVANVESIQHLGTVNQKVTSGLFTFTSPYFTSDAQQVKRGSNSGEIKSLFQIGNNSWTIGGTSKTGQAKFCIKRNYAEDGSFCAFSNIESQLGLTGSISIKEGCNSKDTIPNIENCYGRGIHKVTVEKDLTLPNINGICKTNMNSTEEAALNKFIKIMEIWHVRLNGKLGDKKAMLTLSHTDKDNQTSVFWKVMSIFEQGCPSVTSGYLSILGKIFYNHLQEAWSSKKLQILTGERDRWQEVDSYLMLCSDNSTRTEGSLNPNFAFAIVADADKAPKSPSGGRVKREFNSVDCKTDHLGGKRPGINQDAIQYILEGYNYDIVIEQVWMIFNFVSPYCSFDNHYNDTFLNYFISFLRNTYLIPLQEKWMKPVTWAEIYPGMLSGFDMEIEKKKIISCIQAVFENTTNQFDLISRPNIFYNKSSSSSTNFITKTSGNTLNTGSRNNSSAVDKDKTKANVDKSSKITKTSSGRAMK